MSSIRHVLEQVGQPVEAYWPYLDKLPTNMKLWKPPGKPSESVHSLIERRREWVQGGVGHGDGRLPGV